MTQQTDTLKSVYNIQELITRSSLESTPNRVDGGLADYRIPHPKTLYYLRPLGGEGGGGGTPLGPARQSSLPHGISDRSR